MLGSSFSPDRSCSWTGTPDRTGLTLRTKWMSERLSFLTMRYDSCGVLLTQVTQPFRKARTIRGSIHGQSPRMSFKGTRCSRQGGKRRPSFPISAMLPKSQGIEKSYHNGMVDRWFFDGANMSF
jgi:hypothetical protein